MASTKEGLIQAQIMRYLKSLEGCWAVKTVVTASRGCPDVIVCYEGLFIAFEVKAADGRPSVLQLHNISQIEAAGGVASVVYSLDEVKNMLKLIKALADKKASLQGK